MNTRHAQVGDRLKIQYTCQDQEGELLEATAGIAEITLGNQEVLRALERELLNMVPGETRRLTLAPEQAYGEYQNGLKGFVPRNALNLPQDATPQIDMAVEINTGDEQRAPVTGIILEVRDGQILVDANHPLAGKTLHYTLTFVDFA